MLNIDSVVDRVGAQATGHTLKVVEVVKFLNDRGDDDVIETLRDIDGVVQIVSAQEEEVKEGILMPNDLICFFDEGEINLHYLKNENRILYDSRKYVIVNVVKEIGHVEVHAKKL